MAEEDLGEQETPLDQKYGALIKQEKKETPLRSSFSIAPETDSKKAGDIIDLSKRTNLDRDTVKDDFDNIKKTVQQPTDKEYRQLLENAPKTSKWLEDPYNASATQNDRPKLMKLEQSLANDDPLTRVQSDEEVVRKAEVAAQRRYDALVAEEGVTFWNDEGLPSKVTRTPAEREKMKLRLITEEIAKRREQERFIASNEKLTAGDIAAESLTEGKMFKGVPFLSIPAKIMSAEKKAMQEARMSPEDMDNLIQQKRLEAAAERRGTTFGAKLTNVGTGMSEFIGEMALAGGGLVSQVGKGLLGKVATKGLDIGAQTLATQLPHIYANTISGGTPETYVTQDDKGELQINLANDKGQTYALPLVKAVAGSLIDVTAANLPFHPAFKFWNKTAKVNPTVEGFMKAYGKGGAESIIGGIGISDATTLAKELIGLGGPVQMPASIKALMGDKEAMQEVAASGAVFGLAGAAGTFVQRRRAAAEIIHGQAISYRDWLKETSAGVKEMDAFSTHPEVVADSIKGMVKDTPKEFTYVPAQAFSDHYSGLGINPDEFAAELTGKPGALAEADRNGGMLQIPTDQYLTKIGATDAGPVFEKAGATFDPSIPPVEVAESRVKELDKELQAAKEAKQINPEDAKFQETIAELGKSLSERAKEHGVDLAKYVEQNDTVKARKATSALAASTENIEAAKADLGQSRPLLEDVQNLVMKPDEAVEYAKLVKDARDAAHSQLDAEALGELNKDRKRHYDMIEQQVRGGLQKEVERLPENQIRSIMETGLDADGNVIQEGGIKLNREALKETHNETTIDQLPRKIIATAKESGYTPDEAAQLLGFSSGDELVQKLSGMEPMESVIDRRTKEVMGKMRLDELADLPEKAKEAIHNDQEEKVKAYQLKWLLENRLPEMKQLLKRVSNQKQYIKEIRDEARDVISGKSDKENVPSLYLGAEREANRNAREALLGGDLVNAVKFMEMELLNHELYRASMEGRKDARRIREYANEFNGSDKRKLLYAAGEEYLGQSDALLDRFSFRNQSAKKIEALKSLKEFSEAEANEGYINQIPEKLLRESNRKNWRELSLEELRGVETTLKQLENNAKLKTSILEGKELKSLNDIAVSVGNQIRSSKPKLDKAVDSYTKAQTFWRAVKGVFLSGLNDADLYRQMDSGKDGGLLQQHILRRQNEAGTREAQLNERAMYALDGIYGKFTAAERLKMSREKFIPEIGGSLSLWNRMEIAAILGQKGARQRFLDGRGWGEPQLAAITRGLTEKQWQWVRDIHEFLDSNKEAVKEQIERRTGLPAKMVEPEAIETPFGTQEGGYFPFKYDAHLDPKTNKNLEMDDARRAFQSAALQSQTRHGFAEQRAENVKDRRLRFDAGVLFEHIREVNHDLAWSETLRDLNKLLGHKEVAGAIQEHYGMQVYRQLTQSLQDIAVGDAGPQRAWDGVANALRRGTTTANLGLSFMQAATDPVGITQGAARIGSKWMGVGLKKVLGDAVHMENAFKEMMDISEQQRLRSKTFMREINEVRNKVQDQGKLAMYADMGLEKLTGGKIDIQDLHNGFYYMMTKVQIAQEGPLWWGALEKAKSEHPMPADATPEQAKKQHDTWVSMADQAVLDTYGGGQIQNLAPIMKGGSLQKLMFSTFYSFANRTYGLAANSLLAGKRGQKSWGRVAADMALLYGLPALATFGIKNTLRQDDKDLGKRLFQDQLGYIAGSLPLVRELAPALRGQEYKSPAGLRALVAAASFGKSAWEGNADWKDLNMTAGILFHYPALQVERFVRGMESWLDEGRGNPLSPLFGPPSKK